MIGLPLKAFEALEVRDAGRGQVPGRHHAVPCSYDLTTLCGKSPSVCWAVIDRRDNTQVEPVHHMVHVFEDSRLCPVAFGPSPLGLQLLGEGVRVLQAFDIASCARIAVPEPSPTDSTAGLVHTNSEPEAAQAIERVEAA